MRAALSVAALLLAACSSSGDTLPEPLPLTALVVPVGSPSIGAASEGEHDGSPSELRLDLDPVAMTEAAATMLSEHGFVTATTLDWTLGGGEEPADPFERRERMLAVAQERDVDVLVDLALRYDPEVFRRNADTFWLNFPLFLIAGPSNWLVKDQVYMADVELTARVYDRHALEASGADPTDPSSLLLTVSAPFEQTTLDFIDRANGPIDYLTGVFLPSGYLARETSSVSDGLHEAVVEKTTERLVKELLDRTYELIGRTRVAPLWVDPATLELRRVGDQVLVSGAVHVDASGRASKLDSLELSSGAGAPVAVTPASFDELGDARVYPFEARLPFDPARPEIQLECAAGTRDRVVRSYTFRVADGDE